ncbi:MAG: Nif3-like dinuclear metal center hexameric protein [Oligosphaeraceae bacterium]
MVTVEMLTSYLDSVFQEYACPEDFSRNGLQVECPGEISRVAFSVDGRLEVFQEAVARGAQFLFCHHGLFWGPGVAAIRGRVGNAIRLLVQHGISLYGMHLPLDAHPLWGNNARLALALGIPLTAQKPFGLSRGLSVGVLGDFAEPLSPEEVARRLEAALESPCRLYGGAGVSSVRRVGIVTGSGAKYMEEARQAGAELFITGELGHVEGITSLELGMPVVVGGHYATETTGPKAMMAQVQEHFPELECLWIEAPTGL